MRSKTVLFAFCLVLLSSCGRKGFNLSGGAPECVVQVLQPTTVNPESSYPAIIKSKQDVEIRPQVSGSIAKVCVDEGSMVRKGQILFIVDPAQYEAAARLTEVAVATVRAGVSTREVTVNNKRELNKKNIISDYDLAVAENFLASAETQPASVQAQLTSAEQNLILTNAGNPSDGTVDTIPYRLGSLVSPSIQTPLVIVSDINEMYVYSSLTEKGLLVLVRKDGSQISTIESYPEVGLELSDGTTCVDEDKMSTISSVINQNTEAVSIRVTFPNKEHLSRGGGMTNLIIPYHLENAIVIPQKATTEVQDKKFAFVLQPDNTIKMIEINVFNMDNGHDYVVTSGLKVGEKVVLDNISTLKNEQAVKPVTSEQARANFQQVLEEEKQGK